LNSAVVAGFTPAIQVSGNTDLILRRIAEAIRLEGGFGALWNLLRDAAEAAPQDEG
jgi:hypothetical protein